MYDTKIIFSRRLANYLIQNGFELIEIKRDKKNTRRNLYVFPNSAEIEDAIFDFQATLSQQS